MLAIRIICYITTGISILIWLTYGIFYRRNKKLMVVGIVSTAIWVVTSFIVYGI
ncbi:MAG: hypothetical protein ACYCXB_05180 [Candidatus Humimicrobiaceae bacterium]